MNYKNTWLNTQPIFYNTKTLKVSKFLNDCIDFDNFEWDYAGLSDYMDIGYVCFGNTPIKNIKFVQANESLEIKNDTLHISEINRKPIDNSVSNSEEIEFLTLNFLKKRIEEKDKILLPLSGGYDSRYLANIIKHQFKNRIKSFTFGDTVRQADSDEVRYAKKVSEILQFEHQHINIKNNFKYIRKWNSIFGLATHNHGTHQMMFYDLIQKRNPELDIVLSGLGGDSWSGKVSIPEINRPSDIIKYAYSHGIHADSNYAIKHDYRYREEHFEKNRLAMLNPDHRLISVIQNRMMLLRYLEDVPHYFGLKVVSPFTDREIAMRMLKLPEKERALRKWQVEYFKINNIYVEELIKSKLLSNQLLKTLFICGYKPYLKTHLLREIYNTERIKYINKHIGNGLLSKLELASSIPFRGRSLILPYLPKKEYVRILCEYLTLLPLQLIIEERNSYLKKRKEDS